MLARSSLVALAFLTAGCLKDLTGVQMASDGNSSDSSTDTSGEPAVCGNGKLEPGEQCDDGNTDNGDDCESDCTKSASENCGDGTKDPDEECDDGNNADGDACKGNCILSCGDNIKDPGEECDDGNDIDGDGCRNDCTLPMVSPTCGDGVMDPGEECDLGEDENDNNGACTVECQNAACGDGYTHTGVEACDDGNPVNTDSCTETCEAPRCGDGFVQAGEACDNGDDANDDTVYDGCTTMCQKGPHCGDEVLQAPQEECDDGTADGDDLCNACTRTPRRYVFVTSMAFDGSLGGLANADSQCSVIANSADLGTPGAKWIAWLSDDSFGPFHRMDTSYTGWYAVAGDPDLPVAKGWSGLTSGTLMNPINRTEAKATLAPGELAWVNTKTDGKILDTTDHCENWTSDAGADSGRVGDPHATDSQWTNKGMPNTAPCDALHHLFCVENAVP